VSYLWCWWPYGLRVGRLKPLDCWDREFEPRKVHGCSSMSSWSLVQSNPAVCVCVCVIYKPRQWGGLGPSWAVAPQRTKIIVLMPSDWTDLPCDLCGMLIRSLPTAYQLGDLMESCIPASSGYPVTTHGVTERAESLSAGEWCLKIWFVVWRGEANTRHI